MTLTMTLTPLVIMSNDFPLYNPSPGSHPGARFLSISQPVSQSGPLPENKPLLDLLQTSVHVLLGSDVPSKQTPLVQ